MKQARGFTLIELMIVVAVLGIIAAIAYPSYVEQVRSSRRAEAVAEIGRLQLALERWRADRSSYAGSGANYPVPATMEYYTIAIPQASATATGYSITATPKSSQSSDTCSTLTMTVANGATSKSPTTAGCWKK